MLPATKPSKKTIYLDHAATTYLDSRVEAAMRPFWSDRYGNPSSLYKKGREGTQAIAQARSNIAEILRCKASEVIFTAGGTESVNLAIFGIAREFELIQKRKGHLIASAIEHHAVLRSLEALQQEGWASSLIDVDDSGFIKLVDLKAAVRDDTVLISVMYANNEIGTIEPIGEIGKWLKELNAERMAKRLPKIYFHTDACQAAGALDIDVNHLGVDLMSVNGSKIYGPKQIGSLYVKGGTKLRPLIYGGGQEKDLRSGTENVPAIVGLSEALKLAQQGRLKENKRLRDLRDYFINRLLQRIPKIFLNGADERSFTNPEKAATRLPNNINISIQGIEGESLLLYLDAYNICVSTGSACTSTVLDPSHVILALEQSPEYAYSSVRFTLGKQTTKKDLDYAMTVIPGVVEELRRIGATAANQDRHTTVTKDKAFVANNTKRFTAKQRK
jgi:cysteine desulfurase